jgi:hypothetical protein
MTKMDAISQAEKEWAGKLFFTREANEAESAHVRLNSSPERKFRKSEKGKQLPIQHISQFLEKLLEQHRSLHQATSNMSYKTGKNRKLYNTQCKELKNLWKRIVELRSKN